MSENPSTWPDAQGNRIQAVRNGATTRYIYDAANRLQTVRIEWLNLTATYAYDQAGRLTGLMNFNGTVTTYGYDDANRLLSVGNWASGGTAIATYQFTLDGNGNRTSTTQNEPLMGTGGGENSTYTYNTQKNRLLSDSGNSFAYDNEGQLASGYSSNYTFDYEHRLTAVGSTQFTYDGSGNRIQATRNGSTTKYIYDATGNLLAEIDANNNFTYYIYGKGLMAMVTSAGQVYTYHYNATGSTVAMTDASSNIVNKYAYDPFGNILGKEETVQPNQPFTFVGQFGVMTETDGLYYMRARYYDAKVGRFISEDPIGFGGGDVNLMAYVGNNPVNFSDPSGLLAFPWHFGITFVAAMNSGRGFGESLGLAWNATVVDFASGSQGRSAAATVQHAMAGPGQSSAQAIADANDYIQSNISSNLPGAIHAAQDLATPGHAGQPWSGFGLNSETATHILGDVFPSLSTINQAYQNTKSCLK